MKKKILAYWAYGMMTNDEMEYFIKKNNVDFYSELTEKQHNVENKFCNKAIYLYNNLEYFKNRSEEDNIPLDESIISSMREYEQQAFDIINRWRRSIIPKERYADIREVYYIYLEFWNDFIIKNKINLLILTAMPHIPATFFPYAICKCYHIPIIALGFMPVIKGCKLNYSIQSNIEKLDFSFAERYDANREKYLKNNKEIVLPDYLNNYILQYSGRNEDIKRVIWFNEKPSAIIKFKKYYERGKIYISQRRYKILAKKIKYLFEIKLNSNRILNYVEKKECIPCLEKDFFFFPLHLQPECTTLPCGGVFVNQLLVIKMIAHNLPKDVYLYVKEHPSYWIMKERLEGIQESRSKDFYNEVCRLKNVILIKHEFSSLELIDHCKAVVTVTGTAGFEGIFKNKPVLLFGYIYYQYYKNIYNIRTDQQCHDAIKAALAYHDIFSKREVEIYLKTLEPVVLNCGINDKSYNDNGTPPVSKDDIINMINMIYTFTKTNYSDYYDELRE